MKFKLNFKIYKFCNTIKVFYSNIIQCFYFIFITYFLTFLMIIFLDLSTVLDFCLFIYFILFLHCSALWDCLLHKGLFATF